MENQFEQQSNIKDLGVSQKIIGLLQSHPVILQFCKFVGIGFLTTAVDFLVMNLISKSLGVNMGLKLGGVNVVSFIIAVAHSYVWNGNWTFSAGEPLAALKTFWRTALVGFVGVVGVALAVIGGNAQASPVYYLIILAVLAITEIIVWKSFGLSWFKEPANTAANTMLAFLMVSIIGTLINSGLIGLITQNWPVTENLDLNKNIAKVIATAVSLFWNFAGFKVFVFKK